MTNKPTYWENGEPHEMADVRDYWHPDQKRKAQIDKEKMCAEREREIMGEAEAQVDMEIAHERRQLGGW